MGGSGENKIYRSKKRDQKIIGGVRGAEKFKNAKREFMGGEGRKKKNRVKYDTEDCW